MVAIPCVHVQTSPERTPAACPYLRVIVTRQCNHACAYCHGEGQSGPDPDALGTDALVACLGVAVLRGVRKVKLLGGEPLLRRDLGEIVRRLRAMAPRADLSVISGGLSSPIVARRLFAAGLDRMNVTIHGFGRSEHAERLPRPGRAHERRQDFLEALLASGRPVKLNYVYGGPEDEADLGALLAWAAGRRALVNVLDDLHRGLTWRDVEAVVVRLRGVPAAVVPDEDPNSLPTRHLHFADGLRVEIKDQQLGDVAPYRACAGCSSRGKCREGIRALRLTSDGRLLACMDNPALALDLAGVLRAQGPGAAAEAWAAWEEAL